MSALGPWCRGVGNKHAAKLLLDCAAYGSALTSFVPGMAAKLREHYTPIVRARSFADKGPRPGHVRFDPETEVTAAAMQVG